MKGERDSVDDLLVLDRRGDLPEGDRQRLRDALAASAETRLLYEAGRAFDAEAPVVAGDDERIARIERQVQKRLARPRGIAARAWRAAPAAAAAILVASMAIGAIGIARNHARPAPTLAAPRATADVPPPSPPTGMNGEAPLPAPATTSLGTPVGASVATTVPGSRSTGIAPVAATPRRALSGPQIPGSSPGGELASPAPAAPRGLDDGMDEDPSTASPAVTPKTPTAPDLFSAANAARVRGEPSRATALLEQLERQFPSSSEALAAHLSLGVLLLQGGQAGAALDQFRSYRTLGSAAMAPEALWGESQALHELGRASEERAALEELLDRYPQSAYAAAAKKRLASLP